METLQALKRISEYLYMVYTGKHREFMDCIFRSARKMEGESMFVLGMKKKIWNHPELLMQLLFGLESELHATHALSTVREFLRAWYRRTAATNFQHFHSSDELRFNSLALKFSLSIEHTFYGL